MRRQHRIGQQRLQELKEEYGQERVIFIQVEVRSYQQFEGDRNLLWSDKKVTKFKKIVDTKSYLPPKLLSAGIMSETLSNSLNDVSTTRRMNFETIHIY
jgi:hypothetical protein